MRPARFRPIALVSSLALLAGCAGSAGPCNIPGEPALPPAAADECGAASLDRYLGVVASAETRAAIAGAVGDRRIRYIAPGDAVTMDFNPSRLNVETGDDGRITRLRCG